MRTLFKSLSIAAIASMVVAGAANAGTMSSDQGKMQYGNLHPFTPSYGNLHPFTPSYGNLHPFTPSYGNLHPFDN